MSDAAPELQSNSSLDALLDAAVDAIFISDAYGTILRVNLAALAMFRHSESDLLGQNVSILMPEPDRARHDGFMARYRDGGAPTVIGIGREVTAVNAEGWTFPIQLSLGEIQGQERARFVAIIRDLSHEKAAQNTVKELETHLAHADRLVVLGELTAGIAHEINQPLTAIAAFADAGARLLDMDSPEASGELENVCQRIAEQARRAGNVVSRLRSLSRRREVTKSNHEIKPLVQNVLMLFEHELMNSGIQLQTQFEPGLPELIVDEVQVQQVLVNLVKNSIDALKTSGIESPMISVGVRRCEKMLEVRVVDNGPGVPEKSVSRLFEPFYTTKPHGVGLGLSICKNIAVAHGGNLSYSKAGTGGACFTLSIPLTYIG